MLLLEWGLEAKRYLYEQWSTWSTWLPTIIFGGYFLLGFILYLIRYAFLGAYQDGELLQRNRTLLTGLWVRLFFAWLMKPLWALTCLTGVPPIAITTLSVLLATASGVALAGNSFALGGWLYIFSGICDFLDGRLARAKGLVSARGAALDSILDRYSDAAILLGLAWFYRHNWVLFPVLLALVGTSLVPYIRAKGEALGIEIKEVGFMQRAERVVYLALAICLSPLFELVFKITDGRHPLAIAGIILLAISTQMTAMQRLFFLLKALYKHNGKDPVDTWEILKESRVSNLLNNKILWRNLLSAALATFVDYCLFNFLVAKALVDVSLATILGCTLGAVCNFSANRLWTFNSKAARLPQVGRYAFVSVSSALLNAGGVTIMLLLPDIDYRLAWILVRVTIFLAWNFPLHRDYVFTLPLKK